jgi:hypothetical protein
MHMTAKQRYWWEAVVVMSVFCPIFSLILFPGNICTFWVCFVSFLGLLVSGVVLLFRHKTFLGLIPLIFALCEFLFFWGVLALRH